MDTLKTEFLCELSSDLEAPQQIGATPRGTRHIIYVKGVRSKGRSSRGRCCRAVATGSLFVLTTHPNSTSEERSRR